MNPNKQSACHVMSKYAITRAGESAGATCMWRACACEGSASPLHIGPRLRRSVHEAQAAGQVCQNGLQAHRRILRAGAGAQTMSRNAPVSRNSGLGFPALAP
jgi:hypothetical protein